MDGIVSSPYASDFIWPDPSVFKNSQAKYKDARLNDCVVGENGLPYVNDGKSIWIPDQDAGLQMRLLVIAYGGLSGHRGYSATLAVLQ